MYSKDLMMTGLRKRKRVQQDKATFKAVLIFVTVLFAVPALAGVLQWVA